METDAIEFWISDTVSPEMYDLLRTKCEAMGMTSHNAVFVGLSYPSGPYAGTLDPVKLEECLKELNLDQNRIFASKLVLTSWFNTAVAARKPPSVSPSTLPADKSNPIDLSEPSPVEEKRRMAKKGKKRVLTDDEKEKIMKESETQSKNALTPYNTSSSWGSRKSFKHGTNMTTTSAKGKRVVMMCVNDPVNTDEFCNSLISGKPKKPEIPDKPSIIEAIQNKDALLFDGIEDVGELDFNAVIAYTLDSKEFATLRSRSMDEMYNGKVGVSIHYGTSSGHSCTRTKVLKVLMHGDDEVLTPAEIANVPTTRLVSVPGLSESESAKSKFVILYVYPALNNLGKTLEGFGNDRRKDKETRKEARVNAGGEEETEEEKAEDVSVSLSPTNAYVGDSENEYVA